VRRKRLLLNIFGTILIKDIIERAPRSWSYINDSVLNLLVCSSVGITICTKKGGEKGEEQRTKMETETERSSSRRTSEKPNDANVSAGHIPNCTYPWFFDSCYVDIKKSAYIHIYIYIYIYIYTYDRTYVLFSKGHRATRCIFVRGVFRSQRKKIIFNRDEKCDR